MEKKNNEIRKERTHLFSPNINIAISFCIRENLCIDTLKSAIDKAVQNNEIFSCRLGFKKNGQVFYEHSGRCIYTFQVLEGDWMDVVMEQASIPFDLPGGELIRFFALPDKNGTRLLIIAHHLAGDGLSIAYLAEDIMNALAAETLIYKPLLLPDRKLILKNCSLNPIMQLMVNLLNRRWRKTGNPFSYDEYLNMFRKYWSCHETIAYTSAIPPSLLLALRSQSKKYGITINSILITAFIKSANELSDVGIAASIRPEQFTGMGNYATGISIRYRYDTKKDFWKNAQAVHQLIYRKLNNPYKKFFLLKFMDSLEPGLIDSAYFSAYGGYQNKTSAIIQNMFGYNHNPKSISVTNLGKLPISAQYGDYHISDFIFLPPLVPNAKRLFGIVTLEDQMYITIHLEKNASLPAEKVFFDKSVEYLLQLTDNNT